MKRSLLMTFILVLAAFLTLPVFTPTFAADGKDAKADEKVAMVKQLKGLAQDIQKELDGMVKQLDNAGQIVGIGIQFKLARLPESDGKMLPAVVSVIKGKSAEKAGMQPYDLVLSVNGKPFTSSEEFLKEIRGDGKPGRTVAFELQRKGAKMNVTVNTTVIRSDKTAEAKAMQAAMKKEGADLIAKISSVAEAAAKAFEAANAAPIAKMDPRLKPVHQALAAYDQWADKQGVEIDKLLAVE